MKSHPSSTITDLREALRTQFPDAHRPSKTAENAFTTGVTHLDKLGLTPGTLMEVVAAKSCSGASLLMKMLMLKTTSLNRYLALIDGSDSFDPQDSGRPACEKLLWVRCKSAAEAVKSADMLLRDANLPLLLMDLRYNSVKELHSIPSSSWYRMRTLAETNGLILITLTPRKTLVSAHLRIAMTHEFTLADLERPESDLYDKLQIEVTRHRQQTHSIENNIDQRIA